MKLDCVVEIVYKPLKEKGEDSFAYSFEKKELHTQAVFDGCGGAGSWQYAEYKNATGAFISAQSMARAYLDWFRTLTPEEASDPARAEQSFHRMADEVLSKLKRECAPMKISGSMVKAFPCTVSATLMTPGESGISLTTLNSGDSRIYFFSPGTGLVQLTVDDSQGNPDPLESLRDSAPMSNMLNADQPFEVRYRRLEVGLPCAIMTATDGVFGYFRSPMDFEFLLLDTMMSSDSFAQFESVFREIIVKATGDDSACIMSFYGWDSYENVKRKMAPRHEYISSVVSFLNKAEKEGRTDEALDQVWRDYKKKTLLDEMQG